MKMTYEKYYVKFKASQCFGIPHNDHNAKMLCIVVSYIDV